MSDLRTLGVHCRNCGARLVAWYGNEEDADTKVKDVEKCGLCGEDRFKEGQLQVCGPAIDRIRDLTEREAGVGKHSGHCMRDVIHFSIRQDRTANHPCL